MQSSSSPLLGVDEAVAHLLAAARPVTDVETVDTLTALHRILALPLVSPVDVPPSDNAQMDGYALRSADCRGSATRLAVSQRITAGHVGRPLEPGTAARIFTGGLIPEGADAVVMQEDTEAEPAAGDGGVIVRAVPSAGDWIRRRGEDIERGSTVLCAGTRLRAQELGLAASIGIARLTVLRRLRVAIFFTGDELTMPGEALRPGAIYNSSRFTLTALLSALGCTVTDLGIVPDSLDATRATLRMAAAEHDLILTSGGVSVGDEDHVKPAVHAEGRLDLWQIAVKPGKPLAFGQVGNALFIGLPGNPVSSFVTFLLFVRPLVLAMQGARYQAPRSFDLRADFAWEKPDRRQEYLRVRLNAQGGLDLFPKQGSAVLTSTVWGDGLLENPPRHAIRPGEVVKFIPFTEYGL